MFFKRHTWIRFGQLVYSRDEIRGTRETLDLLSSAGQNKTKIMHFTLEYPFLEATIKIKQSKLIQNEDTKSQKIRLTHLLTRCNIRTTAYLINVFTFFILL